MEENQKKQGPSICLRCRSWSGVWPYGGTSRCTRLGIDVGPAFGCVLFEALVEPVPAAVPLPPLTVGLLAVVLRELVHELASAEPLPEALRRIVAQLDPSAVDYGAEDCNGD